MSAHQFSESRLAQLKDQRRKYNEKARFVPAAEVSNTEGETGTAPKSNVRGLNLIDRNQNPKSCQCPGLCQCSKKMARNAPQNREEYAEPLTPDQIAYASGPVMTAGQIVCPVFSKNFRLQYPSMKNDYINLIARYTEDPDAVDDNDPWNECPDVDFLDRTKCAKTFMKMLDLRAYNPFCKPMGTTAVPDVLDQNGLIALRRSGHGTYERASWIDGADWNTLLIEGGSNDYVAMTIILKITKPLAQYTAAEMDTLDPEQLDGLWLRTMIEGSKGLQIREFLAPKFSQRRANCKQIQINRQGPPRFVWIPEWMMTEKDVPFSQIRHMQQLMSPEEVRELGVNVFSVDAVRRRIEASRIKYGLSNHQKDRLLTILCVRGIQAGTKLLTGANNTSDIKRECVFAQMVFEVQQNVGTSGSDAITQTRILQAYPLLTTELASTLEPMAGLSIQPPCSYFNSRVVARLMPTRKWFIDNVNGASNSYDIIAKAIIGSYILQDEVISLRAQMSTNDQTRRNHTARVAAQTALNQNPTKTALTAMFKDAHEPDGKKGIFMKRHGVLEGDAPHTIPNSIRDYVTAITDKIQINLSDYGLV